MRAKLKQILYNYVSNVLKFTPDDGHVAIRVAAESGERFRIEVEDSGRSSAALSSSRTSWPWPTTGAFGNAVN